MLDRHFVFLDLETTGAAAARDRITEIGFVEVSSGRVVGEWSTLINPGVPIPPVIQALTGITDDMVADAPAFEAVAPGLAQRLEGKVLAAHNARFDYGFLKSEFNRVGRKFEASVLCTVRLSRRLYPEHRRHNLDALMERHGLTCSARHRALGDARVLWDLAQTWLEERGAETVSAAIAKILKSPPSPILLPDVLTDDIPEAPGVYTVYGENDIPLYVGRGNNLRTSIASRLSGERRKHMDVKRVDWTRTAGELGALIRESRLVHALSPLHNGIGRDEGATCAWRWMPETPDIAPELVPVGRLPAGDCAHLYGLFRSRASANQALRELALAHELCFVAIGLERTEGPCYARLSKRCRGMCVGEESGAKHAVRLAQALSRLRVAHWPYAGPIAIREQDADQCELHVVDRWCYLGAARTEGEVHELAAASREPQFDLHIYRMLTRYLDRADRKANVIRLATPASYA
ncbi:MAG: exonuclease domain-containing protein [Rhodospirillaceae bacterium]